MKTIRSHKSHHSIQMTSSTCGNDCAINSDLNDYIVSKPSSELGSSELVLKGGPDFPETSFRTSFVNGLYFTRRPAQITEFNYITPMNYPLPYPVHRFSRCGRAFRSCHNAVVLAADLPHNHHSHFLPSPIAHQCFSASIPLVHPVQ